MYCQDKYNIRLWVQKSSASVYINRQEMGMASVGVIILSIVFLAIFNWTMIKKYEIKLWKILFVNEWEQKCGINNKLILEWKVHT